MSLDNIVFEELPKASSYTVNEVITGKVIEGPWCRHHWNLSLHTQYLLLNNKLCELQESDKKLCQTLHLHIESRVI